MSKPDTTVRMRPDGSLQRLLPDGSTVAISIPPAAPMTDAGIEAAARSDPEAAPLTDADFARMRPVSRTKSLRRALGLTQEEFAARFQIPLGTLRDWEQGRAEPDQPARAYLKVIAADPGAVERALRVTAQSGPERIPAG